MAEYFEITYENTQTKVKGRCTQSQWEKIKAHKTVGRAFRLVKRDIIPQAAVEAQQAKDKEIESGQEPAANKPTTQRRKRKQIPD